MSDYLVDTNVLLRWIQPGSSQRPSARRALRRLTDEGHTLYLTAQIQIEFWSVATRSVVRGGLALAPAEVDRKLRRMERLFALLPDSPAILPFWRSLVLAHGITDAQAHDARLVATMQVYGLTYILTYNVTDFHPFTGITAVDPARL